MILEIFLVIIVFLFLKYAFSNKNLKSPHKNFYEIPHPEGFPIVGNISDFFCNETDLWNIFRKRALKYFPIYRTKILNINIVNLLDPEDVEMILSDGKLTSKGFFYDTLKEWTGNGLIVSEGKTWQKRRKLLTKSFNFSVLRNYIEIFRKEADILVDSLQKMKETIVSVQTAIEIPLLKIIYASIIGGQSQMLDKEAERYAGAVHTLTKIIGDKVSKPWMIWAYKYGNLRKIENDAMTIVHDLSTKVCENFEKNEHENWKMMNLMFDAPEIFNENNIKDEIDTFLFAGHDTTRSAILFALVALANYPKYQEELYHELCQVSGNDDIFSHSVLTNMTFLDRFVKECLRVFTTVQVIGRELREDITTKSGYRIPAGTTLLIQIYDIHHSPNLYPEPEKFDPDRFLLENSSKRHPFSFIPFSAGPRGCIGQKFAMLEVKTFICRILKKFKLEPVESIENYAFIPNTVLSTKNDVRVKFVERIN